MPVSSSAIPIFVKNIEVKVYFGNLGKIVLNMRLFFYAAIFFFKRNQWKRFQIFGAALSNI